MKTILTPISPDRIGDSIFETAFLLAKKFDGHVEGFALRSRPKSFIAMDTIASIPISVDQSKEVEVAKSTQSAFRNFMQNRGASASRASDTGPSFGWFKDALSDERFVGIYGRVFDVIVLDRPSGENFDQQMVTFDSALFKSGKPILLAPPRPPKTMGQRIFVPWNCSAGQARAVSFAMPLLQKAQRVFVMFIKGSEISGPDDEQLIQNFQENRIDVEPLAIRPKRRDVAKTILDAAMSLECDLLVKGAYTQSPLKQMIGWGATQDIVVGANLPVFMAH